jgi:chromosome segregation ATPase
MLSAIMKNRIGVIVLVVVCLGLGIASITIKKQATDQKVKDTETILGLSNNLVSTSGKLDEQKQVAAILEKDMETQKKGFNDLSNTLTSNLTEASNHLATTQTALDDSKKEIAKQTAKINELETDNQQLDQQAHDLSNAITNLTGQIADTEKKLAASEGDKAFLDKELKRLMAEKAELERQFNDLTILRAQVAKLKEELNISRRLEWIRQGLFARADQKGAQQLMQGAGTQQVAARTTKPAYDLNVEVSADGSVKVIPPLTGQAEATNSPPAK